MICCNPIWRQYLLHAPSITSYIAQNPDEEAANTIKQYMSNNDYDSVKALVTTIKGIEKALPKEEITIDENAEENKTPIEELAETISNKSGKKYKDLDAIDKELNDPKYEVLGLEDATIESDKITLDQSYMLRPHLNLTVKKNKKGEIKKIVSTDAREKSKLKAWDIKDLVDRIKINTPISEEIIKIMQTKKGDETVKDEAELTATYLSVVNESTQNKLIHINNALKSELTEEDIEEEDTIDADTTALNLQKKYEDKMLEKVTEDMINSLPLKNTIHNLKLTHKAKIHPKAPKTIAYLYESDAIDKIINKVTDNAKRCRKEITDSIQMWNTKTGDKIQTNITMTQAMQNMIAKYNKKPLMTGTDQSATIAKLQQRINDLESTPAIDPDTNNALIYAYNKLNGKDKKEFKEKYPWIEKVKPITKP